MKGHMDLTELGNACACSGALQRRRSYSAEVDVLVWLSTTDYSLHGFQLCYGKPLAEHVPAWRQGSGLSHLRLGAVKSVGLGRTPITTAASASSCLPPHSLLESVPAEVPSTIISAIRQCLREADRDQ